MAGGVMIKFLCKFYNVSLLIIPFSFIMMFGWGGGDTVVLAASLTREMDLPLLRPYRTFAPCPLIPPSSIALISL